MGAVLVVPSHVAAEFVSHRVKSQRHEDSSGALRLHRTNGPLNDGNARVFPDRAEPWANATFAGPVLEGLAEG